jgi:hypothetical protein
MEKAIKVEIIQAEIAEELKPYVLPALKALLTAPNPYEEHVVYNLGVLFDMGLVNSGVIQVSLKTLAEAYEWTSFDEEMNRVGDF